MAVNQDSYKQLNEALRHRKEARRQYKRSILTCGICDGTGVIKDNKNEEMICPYCDGTGKRRHRVS